MTQVPHSTTEVGRSSAFIVYALYLLSIPSFAIFALIGVIVALTARGEATGLARSHLDDQVRIWFIAFWWHVGLAIVFAIGLVLTLVLVGFPIIWAVGLGWLILMIWFTIKSLLGLLALLDGRGR
jgi:uncharacterized membrane protein